MLDTMPDTDHIISQQTLHDLTPGMKMAVMSKLADALCQQVEHPDDWYKALARYHDADGTDWATTWAAASNDAHPELTPPEDVHETLPAVLDHWRQTNRALDNTMLTLSKMTDRAIAVDKETVLGIPTNVKKWQTGHSYIAHRLGIETRQAAQYKNRAQLVRQELSNIEGPGQAPQLPLVAQAYRAGEVPPENLDSIVRSLNQVTKYLRSVHLTPENIRDVITQLDESFRNAATTVKPAELSKMTDDILKQTAAIIDSDGPPPQEVLNKVENSFRYRIVNGKLKVEIVTDIMNLELFLGIFYAGLNFRAHHNRYYSSPEKAQAAANDLLTKDSTLPAQTAPDQTSIFDADDEQVSTDDNKPASTRPTNPDSFLDDVMNDVGDDATPAQILGAAEEHIDAAINDREIHAVTIDGRQLTKEEMDRLDGRSRSERLHDIYFAHLRATGRLDPSVQGLSLFGGAPTQLRVALDYQTLSDLLAERLPEQFHLPDDYRRPPGMEGFDTGSPRFLQGIALAPEQLIDTVNDDGTTLIEIDLSEATGSEGKLRIPKLQRGHPFISRAANSGTTAPQALRAQLCDAEVIPQVLGTGGVLLDRGRAIRTYPVQVKRELANLGACSIPDCRTPVAYTDGHHLIWWAHGGKTSTENMTLLCPSCHTLVHQNVWTPVFDGNGQLYWKPAAWLDPSQTPVRNTYWDAIL